MNESQNPNPNPNTDAPAPDILTTNPPLAETSLDVDGILAEVRATLAELDPAGDLYKAEMHQLDNGPLLSVTAPKPNALAVSAVDILDEALAAIRRHIPSGINKPYITVSAVDPRGYTAEALYDLSHRAFSPESAIGTEPERAEAPNTHETGAESPVEALGTADPQIDTTIHRGRVWEAENAVQGATLEARGSSTLFRGLVHRSQCGDDCWTIIVDRTAMHPTPDNYAPAVVLSAQVSGGFWVAYDSAIAILRAVAKRTEKGHAKTIRKREHRKAAKATANAETKEG